MKLGLHGVPAGRATGAVCPLPGMQTHTAKFIQTLLYGAQLANARRAHFHVEFAQRPI